MEALIIAAAALILMVLIDAGYWIASSLMRWAPVLAAGLLAAKLANDHGAQGAHALVIGAIVCVIVRRLLRPRYIHDSADWPSNCAPVWRGPAWTRTRNQTVMSGRL